MQLTVTARKRPTPRRPSLKLIEFWGELLLGLSLVINLKLIGMYPNWQMQVIRPLKMVAQH